MQSKKQKIFFCTTVSKFQNFNIKNLQWSKTNFSKETKQDSKKRYFTTNFRSSHWELFCKKSSPKNPPPVYMHIMISDIR